MKIGVLKESQDPRVALIPANIGKLIRQRSCEVLVESQAGVSAGFADAAYQQAGAQVFSSAAEVIAQANIIVVIQANTALLTQIHHADNKQPLVIGMFNPLVHTQAIAETAELGLTTLALELIPRSTRAQSMDVLSSLATIAGYKAVILAALEAPRIFPMLMTAAGTLKPCRTFVMGVGVAGLQACATAKRLGAVVEAYDIRPAAREQILSVGAKPVELDLATENTESSGGYATEQSAAFLARQQQAMAQVLAQQNVVITTAAIPGKKAPILITKAMVEGMQDGTVIVDLAAETGGNCELTQAGETVIHQGVIILGPKNITALAATHTSQMYSTNVENLLKLLLNQAGELELNVDDDIIASITMTHQGQLIQPRLRELLGLPTLTSSEAETEVDTETQTATATEPASSMEH